MFSNQKIENPHNQTHPCGVQLEVGLMPETSHKPIDVCDFPEHLLGKCLWGASYSAVLFSFLRNLTWVECGHNEYTTYLEVLLSFQLYTGVYIPTQLSGEKHKVNQSHSFDGRVSKHPSLNTSL